MSDVMGIGNLARKIKAFGAKVKEVDGHNVSEIEAAVKSHDETRPTIIICYTDPCKGFPLLKERAPKLHYVRFKSAEEKKAWESVLSKMHVEMKTKNQVTTANAKHNLREEEKKSDDHEYQEEGIKKKRKTDQDVSSIDVLTKKTEKSKIKIEPTKSSLEMVTRPHRAHLLKWAQSHPKAIILTADLTSSCEADLLRDELPNQHMSFGMAEQNMMSFAGGLAREGFHPYIHTFAVFVTRRPFDQVAMSIAVPNLPVRLLGFLPG